MNWTDYGLVLSARRHGETSAVVALFTREHGRHLGLVRGGASRRAGGICQPGNLVAAGWRGRLAEHLGTFTCEMLEPLAVPVLDDALRLETLVSTLAVLDAALPEREAHGALFDPTLALLRRFAVPDAGLGWAAGHVRWECRCLAELGFGLDLSACAATGTTVGLAYVSPRTGRAVSAAAGAPYADRLLGLPAFLTDPAGESAASAGDVALGLAVTGHFIERHVLAPHERPLPAARRRLADRWRRLTQAAGTA